MWKRIHAFPWFRMGTTLLVLGAATQGLEALGNVDLSPIATRIGVDPAMLVSCLGVAKIAMRFVLMLTAGAEAKEASQ